MLQLVLLLIWAVCVTTAGPVVCDRYENTMEPKHEPIDPALKRTIKIEGNQFILDGKPFKILSGSIHYFLIPQEHWHERLLQLKAAGFNTVTTTVPWTYHAFCSIYVMFGGNLDLIDFVRKAHELDLKVILRPGPYINSQTDYGGLPVWLNALYPNITLRSTDDDFMYEVKYWLQCLITTLAPRTLYGNGGPIIMFQIENEYGQHNSPCGIRYKLRLYEILYEKVGKDALYCTTDTVNNIQCGYTPDALPTISVFPGQTKEACEELRKFLKTGPLMISNLYSGWYSHWGEPHHGPADTNKLIEDLRYILDNNDTNVNIYMFAGGTYSFSEAVPGATTDNGKFSPVTTSYDYGAPIAEGGYLTPNYYAIRKLMIEYFPDLKNVTPPLPAPKSSFGPVRLFVSDLLLTEIAQKKYGTYFGEVKGAKLPLFKDYGLLYAIFSYQTTLKDKVNEATFEILQPRDRVYVYVDGNIKGIIDRSDKKYNLTFGSKEGSDLFLLVEPQGHVCQSQDGVSEIKDFKGILGNVTYNNKALDGIWKVTGYELLMMNGESNDAEGTTLEKLRANIVGPIWYTANFVIKHRNFTDTFLDTTGWGKGYVWINTWFVGRYWASRGPQKTLFIPGSWFHHGKNRLLVLELEYGPGDLEMNFIDHPILNGTISFDSVVPN